jgi:hypothetical protein
VIDAAGVRQVTDVKMDMTDDRAGRGAIPVPSVSRSNHGADVQRFGHHMELVPLVPPRVPRPVGVDLDTEAIRISQIQRLTDGMISHALENVRAEYVGGKPAKRRPIRQQDGKVKQPEPPTGASST